MEGPSTKSTLALGIVLSRNWGALIPRRVDYDATCAGIVFSGLLLRILKSAAIIGKPHCLLYSIRW